MAVTSIEGRWNNENKEKLNKHERNEMNDKENDNFLPFLSKKRNQNSQHNRTDNIACQNRWCAEIWFYTRFGLLVITPSDFWFQSASRSFPSSRSKYSRGLFPIKLSSLNHIPKVDARLHGIEAAG